jgi:hypothetical protein
MLRLDNFEFFRDTHAPRATIAEARRLIDVPPTSSFSREASGNSSTLEKLAMLEWKRVWWGCMLSRDAILINNGLASLDG